MMFGTEMELPWDDIVHPDGVPFLPTKDPEIYADQLRARLKMAQAAGLQLSEATKEKYTSRGKIPVFNEGDTVYRREMRPGKGQDGTKWRGPYVVRARRSDVTYELELLNPREREQRKCTAHVSHLRPCGRLNSVPMGTTLPPRAQAPAAADEQPAVPPACTPPSEQTEGENAPAAAATQPKEAPATSGDSVVPNVEPATQAAEETIDPGAELAREQDEEAPGPAPCAEEMPTPRRRGRPRKGEKVERTRNEPSPEEPEGRNVGTHNLRPRRARKTDSDSM
ncbi:Hypothetical predicted protein [Cloeon dipterum]|nr:Hypothetical predicted protein [Cloeon dipterum]